MVEFEGVNVERKEASAGSGRLFVEKKGLGEGKSRLHGLGNGLGKGGMGAHRAEQLLRRQLQRDRQGELGDEIGGPVTAQLSPQQGAALPVEYQLDKAPLTPPR